MAGSTLNTSGGALVAPNTPPTSSTLLAPGQSAFQPQALGTFGAAVPTTAPSGQTSTSAPAATPTTVVSSQPAVAAVTKMTDTAKQGAQDIATQNQAKQTNAARTPVTLGNGVTVYYDSTGKAYDASGNVVSGATIAASVKPADKTPEQQIADTPDTGTQWIYDAQGNRVQNPVGTPIPTGYSTTNPVTGPTTPVADQTTDTVGNTYKQFSDGTYGKYNALGAYIGTASQNDFTNSKNADGILTSLQQVLNGTYPLTADQQAQIDGIKQSFLALITQQTTANANFTGATTVAENLYGMGTSLTGLGEIKGTVDAGIAKIADLNNKMVSAVAQMQTAFKQDNLKMLQTAYDIYSNTVKSRQDEIDKLQVVADGKLKDARTEAEQIRQFNVQEQDKVTQAIDNTAEDAAKGGAPAAVLASIKAATNATDAIVAAGQYLQASSNPDVAEYLMYRNQATAAGQAPVPFESWQNTRDYNKAYNTAKAEAAGKAAGTPADLTSGGGFSQGANTKADVPKALQPYANKSASGAWYVDLSSASATNRAKLAALVGPDVQVITDKNQAADLKNQADAVSKLNIIAKLYGDINSTSAASRDLGGAGLTQASILAQTDPKAAAALALNDSALDILKAISGVQGFRGNKEAVDNVKKSLPLPTDTQAVAQEKINLIAAQIQAREEATIGGTLGPNNYTNYVIQSEDQAKQALINAGKQNTQTQTQITNIINSTNPSTGQPYTFGEAAQILGIDSKMNAKPQDSVTFGWGPFMKNLLGK